VARVLLGKGEHRQGKNGGAKRSVQHNKVRTRRCMRCLQ
jgi:hypothetical protein